jgi:drug/metabolite transporter (DMT)-like permease
VEPFGQHSLRGILYISSAVFILAISDALVKWLVMEDMHPLQLLAVRTWITLLLFGFLLRSHGRAKVVSRRWKPQLARGLVGSMAPVFFFLALRNMPLAEATALFFCSTFIMVILSAVFLNEKVGIHRWLAVVVGFSGILLITRPGTDLFRIEAIYVMLAGLFYSIMVVSGRWLSRSDSTLSLVFYFNLALLMVSTISLPWVWQPLANYFWVATAVVAVLNFLAHLGIAQAFKLAPVAVIAPFEYSAMVWATLLGFLIWGDLPDLAGFAGIIVIIGSGVYIAARERRRGNEVKE